MATLFARFNAAGAHPSRAHGCPPAVRRGRRIRRRACICAAHRGRRRAARCVYPRAVVGVVERVGPAVGYVGVKRALRPGQIAVAIGIVALDGTPAAGIDTLQRLLDAGRIGKPCVPRPVRRGRLLHLTLTPRERGR